MKNLFITLFLFGISMAVCSQDYYWYRGTKVSLERGCRKYIIYENDKLSESDKSHITHSEDVFYDEIPNLKWGTTSAHAVINDTAHVHYSTISYRKDGDYYDNLFITHRFYVKLKNQEDLPLLEELAAQNSAEIESEMVLPAWYKVRCKLDAPKNALELANLFYETTDLFSATEPEMINTILPDMPKAIKSLCDEWNVLGIHAYAKIDYEVFKQRLTTDTIIGDLHYTRLEQNGTYLGALREGTNRDIYYIPASATHEYLLYAFNAEIGDSLSNLWYGGKAEWCPNGYNAIVKEISEGSPRIFTIEVEYTSSSLTIPWTVYWTEGVGLKDGPVGQHCPGPNCEGDYGQLVLCAYENGEQVYVSEWGEAYGCEFESSKFFSDEWHMLEPGFSWPYKDKTFMHRLTNDTVIYGDKYVMLESNKTGSFAYEGAVYEDPFRESIFYIPAGSTHEYLLYNFRVQVGQTLTNLWIGGQESDYNNGGFSATVEEILGEKPSREITLKYLYQGEHEMYFKWIERVGMTTGPAGWDQLPGAPADPTPELLCAYKNGEQVYASPQAENYDCCNKKDSLPYDTIPLFIKDGPGTSTVEPVDPNEIVAVLKGDLLYIYEYIDTELTLLLTMRAPSNAPAKARQKANETFLHNTSVQLTEEGLYTIQLTNPEWDYIIEGKFMYPYNYQALETAEVPASSERKILRDGQLLILHNGHLYTPTGTQVQ